MTGRSLSSHLPILNLVRFPGADIRHFRSQTPESSSMNALASCKSLVSKPSAQSRNRGVQSLPFAFHRAAQSDSRMQTLNTPAQPPVRAAAATYQPFAADGHIVVTATGTGHVIVDKVLARQKIKRHAVLRVPSFLGVARIVAQTELLVIVPKLLGNTLASQERVQVLRPPVPLASYKVKQHWHERFNADAGNIWLRRTMADLFSGLGSDA